MKNNNYPATAQHSKVKNEQQKSTNSDIGFMTFGMTNICQ